MNYLKNPELKAAVTDDKRSGIYRIGRLLNIVQMLDKYITPNLEGRVVKPFDHKVACYYGCLLVRPHEILKFDREEDPQTLDVLMLKAGATPIDWAFKTECCGAGLSVSRTSSVGRLSGKIIGDAKTAELKQ